MWNDSVVTDAGVVLLNRAAAGEQLKITGAKAGTGTASLAELFSATQLLNEKQTLSIVFTEQVDKGNLFQIQFQATESGNGYTANQVGVYAQIGEEEEALLAIFQDASGVAIPTDEELHDFVYTLYATIAIDNTGKLTVVLNPRAYLTLEVLTKTTEQMEEIIAKTREEMEETISDAERAMTAQLSRSQETMQETLATAKETMEGLLQRAALPVYAASIPTDGWTPDPENGGLNSVTIQVQGIAVSTKTVYLADLVQSGSEDTDALAREGWTQVTRMVAGEGQVTVYALEVPEAGMQVQLLALDVKKGTGTAEVMLMRRGGSGIHAKDIADAVVELDHNSYVYDENEHCPTVQKVTLRGNELTEWTDYVPFYVPATDRGEYNVVVLGVREYGGAVNVPWEIQQAEGKVTLSSERLTVKGVMGTVDTSISVTRPGTGAITAESLSPQYATAEITEGNKIKVVSVKAGQATIKVRVAETNNYSAAEKEITVIVQKATGSISVQPTEVSIQGAAGTTTTATLSIVGDGDVSISQSEYVNVSREGTKLTLSSVSPGSDTLNITLAETENYTGASCTLSVSVQFASKTLSENTLATIASIGAVGKAKEFWNKGDEWTLPLDGEDYDIVCRIIDFDHDDLDPSDPRYSDPTYNNGSKKAPITFDMKVCLKDTCRFHTTNDNSCSWRDSEMRTVKMPDILSKMNPEDAAQLRIVTKKTAHSQSDSTIISTADKLFLLSEIEVFGQLYYSHAGEGTQYAYYAAGNSRVKNRSGSAAWWWLRSPSTNGNSNVRAVSTGGSNGYANASHSGGSVSAGFCV